MGESVKRGCGFLVAVAAVAFFAGAWIVTLGSTALAKPAHVGQTCTTTTVNIDVATQAALLETVRQAIAAQPAPIYRVVKMRAGREKATRTYLVPLK